MEYYFKYEEIVDAATIHLSMSGPKFDFLVHLPKSLQDFNPGYLVFFSGQKKNRNSKILTLGTEKVDNNCRVIIHESQAV